MGKLHVAAGLAGAAGAVGLFFIGAIIDSKRKEHSACVAGLDERHNIIGEMIRCFEADALKIGASDQGHGNYYSWDRGSCTVVRLDHE